MVGRAGGYTWMWRLLTWHACRVGVQSGASPEPWHIMGCGMVLFYMYNILLLPAWQASTVGWKKTFLVTTNSAGRCDINMLCNMKP